MEDCPDSSDTEGSDDEDEFVDALISLHHFKITCGIPICGKVHGVKALFECGSALDLGELS